MQSTLQPPDSAPRTSIIRGLVLAVAIFLLAFLPRGVGLETFVTTDEIFWVGRSGNFARGLAQGRLDLTFQTGHPGVATMWAGLVGMGSERAQQFGVERREVSRSQVSEQPAFLSSLAAGRRMVALVTALAVTLLSLLTWRLLGVGPAVLGGALLALDPFFLAHSQVLHIDALVSSFMAVALLAGLVRWQGNGGRGYLLLSGVATGLALLSKSPALFLVGFLPLIALLAAWRSGRLFARATWLELLAWSGLSVATYIVAWPALWVSPLDTLRGVLGFLGDNANPRHAAAAEGGAGSGPLFYPLAFLLRTTPLVQIGLALLVAESVARWRTRSSAVGAQFIAPSVQTGTSQKNGAASGEGAMNCSPTVFIVTTLLAYALLFGLAMTIAAKSFDRYLLPAVLPLDLLAGLGLALTARRLRPFGGAGVLLAGALMLPIMVYPLASSLPYALAWYNPLGGGGPAAQRALAVGWGEGLDVVARYLNAKPGAERLKVGMPGEIYTTVLGSQFAGQVLPLEGGDPSANGVDYFVSYIRSPQGDEPSLYDPAFQVWQPEAVARLSDIDYARVYRADQGIPVGATFGETATLEGFGIDTLTTRGGRPLNVKLFWRVLPGAAAEARVTLALQDSAGREAARSDTPLGALETGQVRSRSYQLQLPSGLQPGEYQVWVGLETGARQPLPLQSRPAALATGAPEQPNRAVLRGIRVR